MEEFGSRARSLDKKEPAGNGGLMFNRFVGRSYGWQGKTSARRRPSM